MYARASLSVRSAGPSLTWIERVSGVDHPRWGMSPILLEDVCPRILHRTPTSLPPADASHHEGEWRCLAPRFKEGRAPTACGVRLAIQHSLVASPRDCIDAFGIGAEWIVMAAQDAVDVSAKPPLPPCPPPRLPC